MPTYRSPKGILSRNTEDFFIQSGAAVGAVVSASGTQVPVIDLFNNSAVGSYFHIYMINASPNGEPVMSIEPVSGHSGNFIRNAFPIVAGAAAPYGQLYWGLVDAAQQWPNGVAPVGLNYATMYCSDDPLANFDLWRSQGPLMVIPPGYSCRVWSAIAYATTSQFQHGATFRYVIVPDQG